MSSVEFLKVKAKLLQKLKRKSGKPIALKEAFFIVAKASGHGSWKEMKDAQELSDLLNPRQWSAQWKIWFSSREEAYECFKERREYLLPYQNQFFVCDKNYINALGIEDNDEDLLKVGRDWTRPLNKEAWSNILKKISKHHSRL